MITWDHLVKYVEANYKVAESDRDFMRLLFNMGDGRAQTVFLSRQMLMGGAEEWVAIESPFAEIQKVNLRDVLQAAGGLVCGGVTAIEELLVFRHCVPLANLDINEFERPLALVTTTADELEQKFSGGDRF